MAGGANTEREAHRGRENVGPGPPALKEDRDSGAQAPMIQWLGLRRKFPEPQTALHSLGATCPAETLRHYSQPLLTLLCSPSRSTLLTPTLFPETSQWGASRCVQWLRQLPSCQRIPT